jgi:hypothetical protein
MRSRPKPAPFDQRTKDRRRHAHATGSTARDDRLTPASPATDADDRRDTLAFDGLGVAAAVSRRCSRRLRAERRGAEAELEEAVDGGDAADTPSIVLVTSVGNYPPGRTERSLRSTSNRTLRAAGP